MKNCKNGDSLAGIVIGIFVLSFTLLGINNILNFNKDTSGEYDIAINNHILETNAQNIINRLDISAVTDTGTFYVYKDEINKEFKIMTGTINENYKYIDALGNLADPLINIGKTYKREFTKRIDILKHLIKPSEIQNLIFQYDATNIDGTNNSSLVDGSPIGIWKDLSANGHNIYQNTSSYKPTYKINGINGLSGVSFDGINDLFLSDKNALINNDSDCYSQFAYKEKSFAIVLKTGFDISRDQVIYEQGGEATGYNFMIHNSHLYAGIHNKANDTYACTDFSISDSTFHFPWDSGNQYKSVDLGTIIPDSVYFIMIVQDSSHFGETGNPVIDDSNNKLKIYLNGILASETNHVDPQPEHHLAGLGAVNEWNVRPRDTNPTTNTIKSGDGNGGCDTQCLYFGGVISEFIGWNHALSNTEIRGIQNYFEEKWLNGKSNIEYNSVNINVNKINN